MLNQLCRLHSRGGGGEETAADVQLEENIVGA